MACAFMQRLNQNIPWKTNVNKIQTIYICQLRLLTKTSHQCRRGRYDIRPKEMCNQKDFPLKIRFHAYTCCSHIWTFENSTNKQTLMHPDIYFGGHITKKYMSPCMDLLIQFLNDQQTYCGAHIKHNTTVSGDTWHKYNIDHI